MVKVFVYGTLRTGDCRHGVESFSKMLASEAYIEGFNMLDLGGFPGLVEGEGRIRGEVHEYAHLKVLDSIEGYREKTPDMGLYNRRQVDVETPDGEIEECWVYTFNSYDGRSQRGIVESGDWFEHRGLYDQLALSE